MRIFFISILICIIAIHSLHAQVPGCMDPLATNHDPLATVNNGSCTYDPTNTSLNIKYQLPNTLEEISGIIFLNNKLYALNDGGNTPAIYEIDTLSGNITKTITLGGATNVDWEDLTTDGTYIYVGDFGNNANGNRTNLRFYRFPFQSIANIAGAAGTIPATDIAVINFSYEDQVDFTPTGGNNTTFDCEAVIYDNGNLHLFTKNWIGNVMSHYTISAQPGTHMATKIETYDTGGLLITSATKPNENIVFLLGYNLSDFSAALIMISGFSNMNNLLTTGNKRRIGLTGGVISFGQIESITAVTPTRVLISNETLSIITQRLYGLNTDQWTPQYVLPVGIYHFTSHVNDNQVVLSWEFDEPGLDYFEVESAENENGPYKAIGKVYPTNTTANRQFSFTDSEPLRAGQRFYRIKIVSDTGRFSYSNMLPVKNSSDTQFNLRLSPNPFNDKINVSFYSDKRQTIQFSIIDMQGKIIMTKQLECTPGLYSYQFDGLLPLSSGLYFVRAQTPANIYVQKIVR